MPTEESIRFTFISQALAEDAFTVVEFKGSEGISELYEFNIILDAEDPEIDLKEVLKNPVKLAVEKNDEEERVIHGILARFEQLHEYEEHAFYRAILVPRLWLADQHHENQLFLDKTVPDIIEEILKQAGLTSNDYELRLNGSYPSWEYVCQYNETDYNFISRWMEREGIYYYFDQTDEGEKMIVADSTTAHADIEGDPIRYSPPDSLIPTVREQIREFTCRQQICPTEVILKDYNYRKPSMKLEGKADVDSEGRGKVYIYGEHFKTPEEGNSLAQIRAEEMLCREAVFSGEGTVPPFIPGFISELTDHYRDSYNQRYLITELTHEGVQSTVLSGVSPQEQTEEQAQTPSYFNRFSCIPADIQFRPERKAQKPKFFGTMNAKVDASGDGKYAEIDDEGRYKIILPFDQSGNKDGKASRFVRSSQPYSGADYGMHFPLHKGTEVLLTFVDGDPDRPIIAGSVPNPETMSPITSENQTKCMIKTGGGNQIHTEDQDGSQLVKMYSPTAKSSIRIGAPNPNGESGISLDTQDNMTIVAEGFQDARIGEWRQFHVEGDEDKYVDQHRMVKVDGGEDYTVEPGRTLTVNGMNQVITNREIRHIESNAGEQHNIQQGRRFTITSGGDNYDVTGLRQVKVTGNETYTVTGDRTVDVQGNHTGLSAGTTIGKYLSTTMTAHAGLNYEAHASAGIELFAGLKYFASFAIDVGYSGGLKLVKESACIKSGLSDIKQTSGPAIKKSLVHLFV